MFVQPWNVVKYHPGANPQKSQSIETFEEDCDFDEDDEDLMENDEKPKKKAKKPPVPTFDKCKTEKKAKPKLGARKKVKEMGAAVGSALWEVKDRFT
jgi:hypothetical protein